MDFIFNGDPDRKAAQDAMREAMDEVILLKLKELEAWAEENDRSLYWIFEHHDPKTSPESFGQALKQRGYELESIRPEVSYDFDGGAYAASLNLAEFRIIVRKVIYTS